MIKVKINNFSCIDEAEFEIGRLTVLIGPQASGKSVICKLHYFFLDVLNNQANYVFDGLNFEDFINRIRDQFFRWFPVTAWGNKLFVIDFTAGSVEVRLTRTNYRGAPADNIRIWVSKSLRSHYTSLTRQRINVIKNSKEEDEDLDFSLMIGIHEAAQKSLNKLLGDYDFTNQIFVPAGRSFFTSIGKALSVFEHGGVLDPLILNFGRLYARYRDVNARVIRKRNSPELNQLTASLNEIFGGEIKSKGGDDFVLTSDGRQIPFSSLSSGQQELLPLIVILPRLVNIGSSQSSKRLAYIEEPEAHLFPAAQSKLIAALASIVKHSGSLMNMVLTTHSPYVLVKINNLIKAGVISKNGNDDQRDKVSKIVPIYSQLPPGYVKAYAIIERRLVSITDETGLIAADYLDDVSGDMSGEYSELLSIEYSL